MYPTLVQFCREAKSESREPEDFLIPACSFSPIILLSCSSPIILLIFPSDAAPLIKELLGCSNYSYLVQYFLFCQILQYFPFLQNFAKFPLFAKLQYRCLSCICCFSCWGRELVPNWPWIIFLKSGRNHHLGSRSGWAKRAGGSKVQPTNSNAANRIGFARFQTPQMLILIFCFLFPFRVWSTN